MPAMIMRHYREKEIPVSLKSVQGDTAVVGLTGSKIREVRVKAGDAIPGSNLIVIRVRRRMENSKDNLGKPTEISVMEVQDRLTGISREWISGIPAKAHDPLALVEDGATGKRYIAAAGQRFHGPDGVAYMVSEVRPSQMVIRNPATGEATTIPLRGPRG